MLEKTIQEGDAVLDVGCFLGDYSECVSASGGTYFGIDVTPKFVADAQILHPKAKFGVGDARNIRLGNQEADVVFCAGLLIHLPEIKKVIHELWRVTKRVLLVEASTAKQKEDVTDSDTEDGLFLDSVFREEFIAGILNKLGASCVTSSTVGASAGYPIGTLSTLWVAKR